MAAEGTTSQAQRAQVLRANFGAHILLSPEGDLKARTEVVDAVRKALGAHPAVSRLDTRGMHLGHRLYLGIRPISYSARSVMEVVALANGLRTGFCVEPPFKFLVETDRLQPSSARSYPDYVDVRWNGMTFLAAWTEDDSQRYWAGGIPVRELLSEVCETAGVDSFQQPPTIASTDLVIESDERGVGASPFVTVEDPKHGRAEARLVLPPSPTDEGRVDGAYSFLSDLLASFYLLENRGSFKYMIERAANDVMTSALRSELDRVAARRRAVLKRARNAISGGRIATEQQMVLYLFASEHKSVVRSLKQAGIEYESESLEISDGLFHRDLRDLQSELDREDPSEWILMADRLAERRSTRYIGISTVLSALFGGVVGSVLTNLLGS